MTALLLNLTFFSYFCKLFRYSNQIMAKKKNVRKTNSFASVIGVKNIFQDEKTNFMVGLLLLVVAVFFIWSFVSFFSTGMADQSRIETPIDGEVMNANGEFENSCGSIGAYAAYFFMKRCFGLPAFIIPFFLLLAGMRMMRAYEMNLWKWFMCLAIIMIWSSLALAKFLTPLFPDASFNMGGDHGAYAARWVENLIGTPGLTALLIVVALAFLTYISAETVDTVRKMLNPMKFMTRKVKFSVSVGNNGDSSVIDSERGGRIETEEDPTVFDNPSTQTVTFDEKGDAHATLSETGNGKKNGGGNGEMTIEVPEGDERAKGSDLVQVGTEELAPYDPKRDLENYHYPTLDLLKKYDNDGKPFVDMEEQKDNRNRIVEVLHNFGVEISSIKATVGPTITLYEITPAQGVRISKIRNLEDDIALSLSALGIRIIAPIPGKGTIGIEVPNVKANIVSMESILNSKKFQETTMELPCAIGKTITNEVFMFDLAKIPHLLVAGATGQGKSVGLNAIITSLLYKKHPAEMKIVLVDPKKVEFSIYSPIANHFLAKVPDDDAEPIITDVTKVVRTLNSLCKEMDTRYDLLKMAGARNVKEYNKKFTARQLNPERGHRYMPYIVVVIDEFGDLIMTAGKEIELPIARIAQLARAVGIHMVIATQRPTTSIITGNIKANFPGRIAFKVSAGIDSKTILDRPGAQQLIGRGDMLFLNGNDPVRVQCAFVDTPEVERINQFIAQQQGYLSPFELPEPDVDGGEGGGSAADVDMQHLDPLFDEAARLIVLNQSGSTSLIQRKFSIGYNRAGRLMDQMEKAGIVGVAMGSKPREVLIQDEVSLDNLLKTLR